MRLTHEVVTCGRRTEMSQMKPLPIFCQVEYKMWEKLQKRKKKEKERSRGMTREGQTQIAILKLELHS